MYRVVKIANQPAMATLMTSKKPGTSHSEGKPLAKTAAIHYLHFEKESYVRRVVEVDGNKSGVNVSMTKFHINSKTWKKANLTRYTSYPDPNSRECIEYNGCQWAGMFAGVSGKKWAWIKGRSTRVLYWR